MASERRLYERLRRRASLWIHHPAVELAIVLLIVASVGLLVLEAIFEDDEPLRDKIELAGDIITWIFAFEIAIRLWVARKKRRFFRRYWIDILAVLPLLRPFRFFRVLRLLRLFRAGTFLSRRVRLFRGVFHGAVGELTFLGSLTTVLVVAGTAALYLVEERPPFDRAVDTMWFSIYSVVAGEPIGGDPRSGVGRTVTLVLMLGGLTIFGMFIGTISASMVSRISKRSDQQELDLDELTNHVVVCGWSSSGPMVLRELLGATLRSPVVLITEHAQTPDEVPRDLANHELLYHVSGDFTRVDILELVNVREAGATIILSDNVTPRSDQDRDARTVLAAMTIERLKPGIFTCAQLRNRENDALLKMVGVEEIVVPEEYGGVILGSVSRNRGLVRVLDEILSARYGNSFHKVVVPPAWDGRSVRFLFQELKEKHDALLVSVESIEGGNRVLVVNPPLDQIVAAGSVLVVIARAPIVFG